MRLDQVLAEKELARSWARDAILRGVMQGAGRAIEKAGYLIDPKAEITVPDEAGLTHVSPGVLELRAALAAGLDATDRVALDIGALRGGFTEVLISDGAKKIFSMDVEHGQLHPSRQQDPRGVARFLSTQLSPELITARVADISFILLTRALSVALALTQLGAGLVALIKPQFDVGASGIRKYGVGRDQELRQRAVKDVCDWLARQPGWRIVRTTQSPISGGSANIESLVGARRDA